MIGLDTSWGTLKVDGLTATINCQKLESAGEEFDAIKTFFKL